MPKIIINPDLSDLKQGVREFGEEQGKSVTILVEVAQLERFSDLVLLLKGFFAARQPSIRLRFIVYVNFEVTREVIDLLRNFGVVQVFGVESSDQWLLQELASTEYQQDNFIIDELRAASLMSDVQIVSNLSKSAKLTVDLEVHAPEQYGLPRLKLEAVFHDYFDGIILVKVTPGRVNKGQDVVIELQWKQDGMPDVLLGRHKGVIAEIEYCDFGGQTLLEILLSSEELLDLQQMYLEVGRRQGVSSQFMRLARGL